MNFRVIFRDCERKSVPTHKYAEQALIFYSSSFYKAHISFYLNELLTELMNISVFLNESFNGPGRGNDILSGPRTGRKVEGKMCCFTGKSG